MSQEFSSEHKDEKIERKDDMNEKERIIEHHTEHTEHTLEKEAIHPFRWAALVVWICVFSAIVIWAVVQTRHNVNDIRDARRGSIYASCVDQNTRHDHTIAFIKHLAKKIEGAHPTTAKKKQIAQAVAQDVLLIDALAPKRDCVQVVLQSERSHQLPPRLQGDLKHLKLIPTTTGL